MKKLFFILLALSSFCAKSQDSSGIYVSISMTFRDIKYISDKVYDNNYLYGDLRDSLTARFRSGIEPDENNSFSITATIKTWLSLVDHLRRETEAVHSNTYKRISDALKLLNTQTYLIRKLSDQEAETNSIIQAIRLSGKNKIKKTN